MKTHKKKKVVITTTNLSINLKSNTMKNTIQRYGLFANLQENVTFLSHFLSFS